MPVKEAVLTCPVCARRFPYEKVRWSFLRYIGYRYAKCPCCPARFRATSEGLEEAPPPFLLFIWLIIIGVILGTIVLLFWVR